MLIEFSIGVIAGIFLTCCLKNSSYEEGYTKGVADERKRNKDYYKIVEDLKKWLKEIQQEEFDINGVTGVCTEIRINCILSKMQELEEK